MQTKGGQKMRTGKYGDDRTRFDGHFFRGDVEQERRSGYERRRFRYDAHIPERRGRNDRRNGTGQESSINVAAARQQEKHPGGPSRIPSQTIFHRPDTGASRPL
jgi:hypothetical protein